MEPALSVGFETFKKLLYSPQSELYSLNSPNISLLNFRGAQKMVLIVPQALQSFHHLYPFPFFVHVTFSPSVLLCFLPKVIFCNSPQCDYGIVTVNLVTVKSSKRLNRISFLKDAFTPHAESKQIYYHLLKNITQFVAREVEQRQIPPSPSERSICLSV